MESDGDETEDESLWASAQKMKSCVEHEWEEPIEKDRDRPRASRSLRGGDLAMRASERRMLSCSRCGWAWFPRTLYRPKVCPRCKSYYWNKPRVRSVVKKEGAL